MTDPKAPVPEIPDDDDPSLCDLYVAAKERIAKLEQELAALRAENEQFVGLGAKCQSNPTGKLTVFEAIRNHMQTANRLCNDNYGWAKRLEAENARLKAPVSDREWVSAETFYDGTDHDYDRTAMEREALDALIQARAEGEGKNDNRRSIPPG